MALQTELGAGKEMNMLGHLSELRNKLIQTAIFFMLAFIVSFIFVKDIYNFFDHDIDFVLNITSPGDTIWIYFSIAGLMAIIASIPILFLQIWLYIKPALTTSEKKISLAYISSVFILFILGLIFGYLMFTKLILPFLFTLNRGMFNEIFTVEKYFKFMFKVTIPFAILFEIPIIAMFLTSIGIITPDFLKKVRKYAYFVLLVVGALVTPPDILLQLSVAIPLFFLYEVSIHLSKFVYRKRLRKQDKEIS